MTTTGDAEDLVEAARTVLNLVERVVEKGKTFECAVKLIEPILTAAKEMTESGWSGEDLTVTFNEDNSLHLSWKKEEGGDG